LNLFTKVTKFTKTHKGHNDSIGLFLWSSWFFVFFVSSKK